MTISSKIGRVGVLYWRDPALSNEALNEQEYNNLQVREFCCRKATIGLIRRDRRGDYVVSSELGITGREVEFDQVTVVPKSLVFKVGWLKEV